jgi:DNA-binding transcriptional LysR family regulator
MDKEDLSSMNRHHLAAFYAVARELSFSRGAERLMVSQPAVSQQVRSLEAALGLELFDRLPKGIRLTEAGERLMEYAGRMDALEREAAAALEELRGGKHGRLLVGASFSIAAYLLPEVLGAFGRRWPEIELRLEVANSRAIAHRVSDLSLDLGLTSAPVGATDLVEEPFHHDRIVAIASSSHALSRAGRVTLKRFCREPLLVREVGSGTRTVVEEALAERGMPWRPHLELGSTEAIKGAVAAGVGVAFVSHFAVASDVAAGRLAVVPIAALNLRRALYLVRARGKKRKRAEVAFVERLDARLTQRPG